MAGFVFVNMLRTLTKEHIKCINFEENCGPLSKSTFIQALYAKIQWSKNTLNTSNAYNLSIGIAHMNSEKRLVIMRKNWCPDLDLESDSKMSIAT